jgi:hypothetical protein
MLLQFMLQLGLHFRTILLILQHLCRDVTFLLRTLRKMYTVYSFTPVNVLVLYADMYMYRN